LLGSRSVTFLPAGTSDAGTVSLTLPSSTAAGTYYILAKADAPGAVPETNESNNVKAGAALKVGPDLTVISVATPAVSGAGEAMVATDTTKNLGAGPVAASETGFYLSTNTVLDAADILLGTRAVPGLAGGDSNAGSVSLIVPASIATGNYYVLAKADQAGTLLELLENNNVKASAVVPMGPDLIVSALTGPSTTVRGATITVNDTSRNQGGGGASTSTTTFYLSGNATVDATDVILGSHAVDALAAGASSIGTASLVIPTTIATGNYYVIAKSDSAGTVGETTETNNIRTLTVKVNP
jgi:subtilase family serine protease